MRLPEPSQFTLALLAERWSTTEAMLEHQLSSGLLFASINLEPTLLLDAVNTIADVGVLRGGQFELAGYRLIDWDSSGECDLHKMPSVYLKKLAGDPLQYKNEWVQGGSLRSLRYMWRLNAFGHQVFRPASVLVIKKQNIFIDLAEVKSFEKEHGGFNEKDVQDNDVADAAPQQSIKISEKKKSRSSEPKAKAIAAAKEYLDQKKTKQENADWNEAAKSIQGEVKKNDGGLPDTSISQLQNTPSMAIVKKKCNYNLVCIL